MDRNLPLEDDRLSQALEALASPLRLGLLRRLVQPAFVADLTKEMDLTRQALKRHLGILVEAGLVEERPTKRGVLPATAYVASPAGLFAFKETIAGLALPVDPALVGPFPTRDAAGSARSSSFAGAGLLLVHGDLPGRWYPLQESSYVVGRNPHGGIGLPYDPFASARHAHLLREAAGWRVVDLHSRNGTLLNFERLAPGEACDLRAGDVLTVGRSRLVFRDGP